MLNRNDYGEVRLLRTASKKTHAASKERLATENVWQQRTFGNKERLATKNVWQQRTFGNKERLATKNVA